MDHVHLHNKGVPVFAAVKVNAIEKDKEEAPCQKSQSAQKRIEGL